MLRIYNIISSSRKKHEIYIQECKLLEKRRQSYFTIYDDNIFYFFSFYMCGALCAVISLSRNRTYIYNITTSQRYSSDGIWFSYFSSFLIWVVRRHRATSYAPPALSIYVYAKMWRKAKKHFHIIHMRADKGALRRINPYTFKKDKNLYAKPYHVIYSILMLQKN